MIRNTKKVKQVVGGEENLGRNIVEILYCKELYF
jgi:hypothetical protein